MTKYRLALFLAACACCWVGYAAPSASGAAPAECTQTSSREIVTAQSNPYYAAILSLRWGPGQCCDSFSLRVLNNTDKPMEILWDKTFYVHNGMRNGRVVFGQSVCSDADLPETSSIAPEGSFETAVWPEILVHSSKSHQNCLHSFLETGQDGIFLTVKGDGAEMGETVTLNVDFEHLFPPTG